MTEMKHLNQGLNQMPEALPSNIFLKEILVMGFGLEKKECPKIQCRILQNNWRNFRGKRKCQEHKVAKLGAISQLCKSGGTVTGLVNAWKLKGQRGRKLNQESWHQQRAMGVPSDCPPPEASFEWTSRHGNAFTRAQESRGEITALAGAQKQEKVLWSWQERQLPMWLFSSRAAHFTHPPRGEGEWISAQLFLAPVSPVSVCRSQAGPTDPMPGPLHLLALQPQAPGSLTQGLGPRSPRSRISDRNRSMPLGNIIKS